MRAVLFWVVLIAISVAAPGSARAADWNGDCTSVFELSAPAPGAGTIVQAQAIQQQERSTPPRRTQTRQGPQNLQTPQTGPVQLIPKGDCCQEVLGGCATICNKEGGCTGSGDCITNPN